MGDRRAEIRMTNEELTAFLAEQRTVILGTAGPDGRPHLTPLWFVPRPGAGTPVMESWTYARSQKAANLRRDRRATLLVEDGASYEELRGAMLHCDVELIDDVEVVAAIGYDVIRRSAGRRPGAADGAQLEAFVARQAAKRVGLRCTPTHAATWDHRKLGGGY